MIKIITPFLRLHFLILILDFLHNDFSYTFPFITFSYLQDPPIVYIYFHLPFFYFDLTLWFTSSSLHITQKKVFLKI